MQVYKGIILTGGIGYDSNIYLIDNEVLVDTGTGIFFNEIKEELENLKIDLKGIHTIINTHCHFDHSGGDKSFRDLCKAEIAIHEEDKEALETGEGTLAELFGKKQKAVTVDRVLKEGDKIKTKNFNFVVISTPGHTKGSICLYEKNKKILISGDTIFADSIGRTDFPTGNQESLLKSLKKLSKLNIMYLLPGHGIPKVGGIYFLLKQMISRLERMKKEMEI
ncbi:MAG: MBL fold metallo-hydrolase [Candidatus Aenigmatarchaeota archaeon]